MNTLNFLNSREVENISEALNFLIKKEIIKFEKIVEKLQKSMTADDVMEVSYSSKEFFDLQLDDIENDIIDLIYNIILGEFNDNKYMIDITYTNIGLIEVEIYEKKEHFIMIRKDLNSYFNPFDRKLTDLLGPFSLENAIKKIEELKEESKQYFMANGLTEEEVVIESTEKNSGDLKGCCVNDGLDYHYFVIIKPLEENNG